MQNAMRFGPWPTLGYVDSLLDRAAARRVDPDFLAACCVSAGSGFYLIGGEMVVLKRAGDAFDPMFLPDELAAFAAGPDRLFLGLQQQTGRFGLSLAQEVIEALKTDARFHILDLRSIAVQGLVAPEHLPPLAEAKALLHWHARHRFCSNCGHATNVVEGG